MKHELNELEWSAFCYAAGELTADEAAAFEGQLAESQAAREALARAVEMTQAVANAESLAPTVTIRSRSNSWSRRLTWMAIGSAASLLVALVWSASGLGTHLSAWLAGPGHSSQDGQQLAQVWSQTREALAESSDRDLWYPAHLASEADDSPESANEMDEQLSAEAPAWMTAAVEYAERPDSGDHDPFDAPRAEN